MLPIKSGREEGILDIICAFDRALWTIFTLTVLMLVLSSFSFLFLNRSSGSYTILLVDVALLTMTLAGVLIVLYLCNNCSR